MPKMESEAIHESNHDKSIQLFPGSNNVISTCLSTQAFGGSLEYSRAYLCIWSNLQAGV